MTFRYKMSISSEEYESLLRLRKRISNSKTFADAICGMCIGQIEDTHKKQKVKQ